MGPGSAPGDIPVAVAVDAAFLEVAGAFLHVLAVACNVDAAVAAAAHIDADKAPSDQMKDHRQ